MSYPNDDSAFKLDTLDETLRSSAGNAAFGATILSLGIIWHRNSTRIGAVAPLRFDQQETVALSRLTPDFHALDSDEKAPLIDQHLSRTPVLIKRCGERQFLISPPPKKIKVSVNGRPLDKEITVDMDELGEDIIITLANAAVLSLFYAPVTQFSKTPPDPLGIIGIAKEITTMRTAIMRAAKFNLPVLIRGETGTGKELVARAIHRLSDRASCKMTSVNMAAITPSLASSELFGVKKGAFTGAAQDKAGLFERADRGILFLDEIGDTPPDVQPMLLRALEFGEVQRIGDDKTRSVDVRVIAATDRSLESIEGEPSFNQPLLQRLQGFSINTPPLRQHRVDFGILCRAFWAMPDENISDLNLSDISADDFTQLALYAWPGNVRELRNVIQQLRIGQGDFAQLRSLTELSKANVSVGAEKKDKPKYKNSTEISEDELVGALNDANWVIKEAAASLNISRTAIYGLMKKSKKVRNIDDIPNEELFHITKTVTGGIEVWAKHFRVGKEALRKKILALSIEGSDIDSKAK